MQTSKTFSIHFWLKMTNRKGDLAPIYARITVNGKRSEISLKRYISVTYWDSKSKRAKPRTPGAKMLNAYLDDVYANLLTCHKQLTSEFKLITSQSIKSRFLGEDEQHKTLLELVDYHNTSMKSILKFGTLKNYYTTEKYLKKFLTKKIKTNDIYLKQLSYGFIIDFEQFLRNAPSINKRQPLNNNGVMKHLERFKKLLNLAIDLEWIEKNPFARYKLKFKKYKRAFLSKSELQTLEFGILKQENHIKTRDVFVFACYTGLSYMDVKLLNKDNIVKGIDGDYWIFTKRVKTDESVKIPILNKAQDIINKYKGTLPDKLLPVYSNQKVNTYLKEIALQLEIAKQLTFHSARHTFATTVTLSNGVPIETVSKLLGQNLSVATGSSKFFTDAVEGLLSGLIWKLKTTYPKYCTLPHLIALFQSINTKKLVTFLSSNLTSKAMASAFINGIESEKQTAGVKSILANAFKKISSQKIFMALSADEVPLGINSKVHPSVISIVNNPKYESAYSPIIATIMHTVIKQMSVRGGQSSFTLMEEAPTIKLLNMHRIPATLRSYDIIKSHLMPQNI